MRARGLFNMTMVLLAVILGAMVMIGEGPVPTAQGSDQDDLAALSEALDSEGAAIASQEDVDSPALSLVTADKTLAPEGAVDAEPAVASADIDAAVTEAVFETTEALPTATPVALTTQPEPEVVAEPEPVVAAKRLAIITGNRVNVRSGPSTRNGVIGKVVRDQEVELLGFADNGWANIVIDGKEGFMAGDYLRELPEG